MKIAVLGSTGMLGSMVADYLSRDYEVLATTRKELDVTYFKAEDLASLLKGCDWVINCIGAIPQRTNDDKYLMKVNAVFPFALSHMGKPVIQIATDCVYSGLNGLYNEDDLLDYHDSYGQSKHYGEMKAEGFYNIRCSVVGMETQGSYSLLKWFLSQPQGAVVNGYVNHYWNGVTTLQFAKVCQGIIKYGYEPPNMQHLVPMDWVTKYQLLKLFGKHFSREDIEIKPVNTERSIDRRLTTLKPEVNKTLWRIAGYNELPTIEGMVNELSEYVKVLA